MAGSEVGLFWKRIETEIRKVIVGQERAIHDLGVAMLAGGHVLLAAEMEVEGRTADDAIRTVLERVEVPK